MTTTLVGSLSVSPSTQEFKSSTCDASIGLVVGGVNAGPDQFPHMAAIGYREFDGQIGFKCGGSLISDLFVLTVAHCAENGLSPSIVRLGDLDLSKREKGLPEVDIEVSAFIKHEAYNLRTKENDIGLIRMQSAAPFSESIRPACLQQTDNIEVAKAIATGWGKDDLKF